MTKQPNPTELPARPATNSAFQSLSDRMHVWATLLQTKRFHPARIGVTIDNRWRQLSVVALSDEEAQELVALLREAANAK